MTLFNKKTIKYTEKNKNTDDKDYINIICNHFYSEMNKLRVQVESNSRYTTLFFKKKQQVNNSSNKILLKTIALTQQYTLNKTAQNNNNNIRCGSYIAYLIYEEKAYQAVIFIENKYARLYLLDNLDISLLDNRIEIQLLHLIRTKHNFTNIELLNNAIISDISIAKNYFFNKKYSIIN